MRMKISLPVRGQIISVGKEVAGFALAMVVPALLVYAIPSLIPVFAILALIGVVAIVSEPRGHVPPRNPSTRKIIRFVRKAPEEKS